MQQINGELLDSLLATYRLAVEQNHPISEYILSMFRKYGVLPKKSGSNSEKSLDKDGACATIKAVQDRSDADDDGHWVTTEGGSHIHISGEGVPDKGNPHVLNAMSQESSPAPSATSFGGATTKSFSGAVHSAKQNVAKIWPDKAWRVTAHTQEELEKDYPGAKLHVTEGGSTAAVTSDGDIISICKNPSDPVRGKDLIAMAVANGGTKLDSYSGNHEFYVKCGFEPVSWCQWDDQYAPDDWSLEKGCKREPVIFYKYTGGTSQYKTAKVFFNAVPASDDYDAAQKARDSSI